MNIAPGIQALEEPIIKRNRSIFEDDDMLIKAKRFPLPYCNHLLMRKTEDATGFGMVSLLFGIFLHLNFLSFSCILISLFIS